MDQKQQCQYSIESSASFNEVSGYANSEQRNEKKNLNARSSSTGTSIHNSRSRSGTEEHGYEVESEKFQVECESLSHSSHGGNVKEPKNPKRTRTVYSKKMLYQLERVFCKTPYPTKFNREELAKSLGIKERNIQIWFQNRRAKFRKRYRLQKRSRVKPYNLSVLVKSSGPPYTHLPALATGQKSYM